MSSDSEENTQFSNNIPKVIHDTVTQKYYRRGRYFGKGGFSMCYKVIDQDTGNIYAAKITKKSVIAQKNISAMIMDEMSIHRTLRHDNIVQMYGAFEDDLNNYLILELCENYTLYELKRSRNVLTNNECRYFIYNILKGVKYLHDNLIIHRDLKLNNIFLDNSLHVKVGDFGFATRMNFKDQKMFNECGTLYYTSPEILKKIGYTYKTDIWSIGCIMYALLVGKTPFQAKRSKTFLNIRQCDYEIPINMHKLAAKIIVDILQLDFQKRPSTDELLEYKYFTVQEIPSMLPISCLTKPSDIDNSHLRYIMSWRMSLIEMSKMIDNKIRSHKFKNNSNNGIITSTQVIKYIKELEIDIKILTDRLTNVLKRPIKTNDDKTSPSANLPLWISKWIDHKNKYGLVYQLCDEAMGHLFNGNKKLIILSNGIDIHFIDEEDEKTNMTLVDYQATLEKKEILFKYLKRYMLLNLVKTGAEAVDLNLVKTGAEAVDLNLVKTGAEAVDLNLVKTGAEAVDLNLVKTGAEAVDLSDDKISETPNLHIWFKTSNATIVYLTNESIQFDFADNKKIIFFLHIPAVTYIMDSKMNFCTYTFRTISNLGCSFELAKNLRFAKTQLNFIIEELQCICAKEKNLSDFNVNYNTWKLWAEKR